MINRIILIGLFVSIIKGHIISTLDTINVLPYSSEIKLQHNLIIDTTFSILKQDTDSIEYSLDPINGLFFIDNQKKRIQSIIVKYDYYSIPLPTKIGPKWIDLPLVDSLIIDYDLSNNIELRSYPIAFSFLDSNFRIGNPISPNPATISFFIILFILYSNLI